MISPATHRAYARNAGRGYERFAEPAMVEMGWSKSLISDFSSLDRDVEMVDRLLVPYSHGTRRT